MVDISRIDDALSILKSVLEMDSAQNTKHTFPKDVIDRVHEAVKKQDNPNITEEFNRVHKYLQEQGHISAEVCKFLF